MNTPRVSHDACAPVPAGLVARSKDSAGSDAIQKRPSYSAREADLIARAVTRRVNRQPLHVRLRRHWREYRKDYLLIGALIVFYALFIYFTPVNS